MLDFGQALLEVGVVEDVGGDRAALHHRRG